MSHFVADDLSGEGMVILGRFSRFIRPRPQLCQQGQRGHHIGGVHAIVDEAGHLAHADGLQLIDPRQPVFDRAEKTGIVEVTFECEVEDRLKLVILQRTKVHLERVGHALGFLEGGEGPGILLDQPGGAAQVILERAAHQIGHLVAVLADQRVQHDRDGEIRRIMPCLAQRLVVECDLFTDLFDRLAQQVSQDIGPDRPSLLPGCRIAGGGDPDRQFLGHRARLGDDGMGFSRLGGELDRLAAPKRAHLVDTFHHARLIVGRGVFRTQHEIIRMPARGHGQPGASIREIVDHRPFLGDPCRMVQRGDAAARAHGQVFRDRRHRRTGHRRVGIGAAKGVEVPFRRPKRIEPVGIGKFCAFQQKLVFVRPCLAIVRPVIETEIHRLRRAGNRPVRHGQPPLVTAQHQLEAARKGIEKFENRDIEGQARDRLPDTVFVGLDHVVHAGKEVCDIAMLDRHAFGQAGRSRSVDQIGRIPTGNGHVQVFTTDGIAVIGHVDDDRIGFR